MSALSAHHVEQGPATSLRLKLRLSETERQRLTNQLDAERNLHDVGRRWDFGAGFLVGVLTALVTLALCGVFR